MYDCTTPPSQQIFIKPFYCNQMRNEKLLKALIHRNILPTDPNKKIKKKTYHIL